MHPLASLGHSIYRILLRGGSPQRIQYSNRSMVTALLLLVVLSVAGQRLAFGSGAIQIGVFLFTLLSGLYIGMAWLTREVPRVRLRVTQLAILWILVATQLLLLAGALLLAGLLRGFEFDSTWLRFGFGAAVALLALLGINNCLRFALGAKKERSMLYTLVFAVSLAAFYSVMISLLEVVFS